MKKTLRDSNMAGKSGKNGGLKKKQIYAKFINGGTSFAIFGCRRVRR
jgi:hypothetical protein